MKSIKRGRGPSAMGAVGSLFAAVFGIIWTIAAASLGAPVFFCLFGVVFVILGIVQANLQLQKCHGENRYSAFDIVDSDEEPDPLDRHFRPERNVEAAPAEDGESGDFRFCPYCGARLGSGFEFCGKCGKRLPEEP